MGGCGQRREDKKQRRPEKKKEGEEGEEGGVARHLGEHRDRDTAGGLASQGPEGGAHVGSGTEPRVS